MSESTTPPPRTDFTKPPPNFSRVSKLPPDFYARWRSRISFAPAFHDALDAVPAEILLQAIWHQQRVLREALATTNGRRVRVLHPGFWNREAGPDFREAVVQFDSEPPRTGDVEIDLSPSGWRGHAHDRNPAYANVVLHVVWAASEHLDNSQPTLALKERLDAPLAELQMDLGNERGELPDELSGQCSAPLRDLSVDILGELLDQAAQVRLQVKAGQLQARARQCGWEQAFWEGAFRALGYKHNAWPMQQVAESLPTLRGFTVSVADAIFAWQMCLFGVSGLLPSEPESRVADSENYLRRVWDGWWRERVNFDEMILPRRLWRFNGLRPANHPQRRLALAAHWLARGDFLSRLENWFTTPLPTETAPTALLELLQVEVDDFWSWHWTWRSARLAKPQPLIGAQRVTDFAVNVVLPWFWARAAAGNNPALRQAAEQRYFAWPAGESNSVLRLARERLLGSAPPKLLRRAAAQQGLLQIVRDFCAHSDAVCTECRFPDLVRSIPR
ncbi:MAG: DUF2851 family protein [Verrucomicrobia bacterium]|nr:DUF2851 family protein [Verrucomicrobiota bacterium]